MEYSNIYFEKSINGKMIDSGNINLKYDGDEIQIQGKLKNGNNSEEEYINEILFVPSNVNSLESELQRNFLDKNSKDIKSEGSKTKKKKKRRSKKKKSSSNNKKSRKR